MINVYKTLSEKQRAELKLNSTDNIIEQEIIDRMKRVSIYLRFLGSRRSQPEKRTGGKEI